jgi:hypothetical protein
MIENIVPYYTLIAPPLKLKHTIWENDEARGYMLEVTFILKVKLGQKTR